MLEDGAAVNQEFRGASPLLHVHTGLAVGIDYPGASLSTSPTSLPSFVSRLPWKSACRYLPSLLPLRRKSAWPLLGHDRERAHTRCRDDRALGPDTWAARRAPRDRRGLRLPGRIRRSRVRPLQPRRRGARTERHRARAGDRRPDRTCARGRDGAGGREGGGADVWIAVERAPLDAAPGPEPNVVPARA